MPLHGAAVAYQPAASTFLSQLTPSDLCMPSCFVFACSAADDAAAVEAGKDGTALGSEGGSDDAKLEKTPSRLMAAVTHVKESKTGKAISRNKFFKWLTYSINYDM